MGGALLACTSVVNHLKSRAAFRVLAAGVESSPNSTAPEAREREGLWAELAEVESQITPAWSRIRAGEQTFSIAGIW